MPHVAIIQGHPDPAGGHYGHALADAYAQGAAAAGHELKRIEVARLDFPVLRTQAEFEQAVPVADIRNAQETILWADHLVILYPLWLGTMPALLKAFLEQVLRPGFAFDASTRLPRKLLKGRSARIVVTMGVPALVYRWYFGAHGLRNLERNILGFCGIRPIRASLIGMVDAGGTARRAKWLARLSALGRRGL
jgi:putative NADPH-quinone reductase